MAVQPDQASHSGMSKPARDEAQRLRQLARELRASATSAAWPGYAEKLTEAAEQLEQRAVEIDGSVFIQRKDPPSG